MELIPCIQTLAHLNAIFRWPVYGDIRDCDDILLAGDDKTYRLLEDIFQTLENTFRSRTINIGMDEAHMLGRGKYQDLHGFEDRSELLVKHLARVAEIAAAHGFDLIMWGDMFFRLISGGAYYVDHLTVSDEVKKKIPANVNLIYWDYYSTDQQRYDKQIKGAFRHQGEHLVRRRALDLERLCAAQPVQHHRNLRPRPYRLPRKRRAGRLPHDVGRATAPNAPNSPCCPPSTSRRRRRAGTRICSASRTASARCSA